MRQIASSQALGRGGLRVIADESPRRGAPTHRYRIEGFDTSQNRAVRDGGFVPRFRDLSIIFSTPEMSSNDIPDGVTTDAILAIVEDHIRSKLGGPDGSLNQQMAVDLVHNARELLEQDEHTQLQHSYTPRFSERAGAL